MKDTPIIHRLVPGDVPLSVWRAIYFGDDVAIDPAARGPVDKAAATIEAIIGKGEPVYGVNTGFGKLASVRIDAADLETLQRNIVLSHAAGVGEPLSIPVVRLIMALKLASLAQGASGVRWTTLAHLAACLERGLIPVIPGQGSVGASGDLAPLAHMTAALMGVGQVFVDGRPVDAAAALEANGLAPLVLGPKEGLALLNGTQVSTALALAGLFETERVFQAALVTGALSVDAAKGSDGPFDPRIHLLRRHKGQIDVAASLRGLLSGSVIRASHLDDHGRVQDPYCLRCQPQVAGACLDILRQAAATLTIEANAVTDNPLVIGDAVMSGGNFHGEPVAFAADQIALALCEIGSIAQRRISLLVDPALSFGLPAFLAAKPGLNSGFMIAEVTSAALMSENRQMVHPASVDSTPTSANQEDHVSMACHGARRLLPMTDNLCGIVGIEAVAAVQGIEFRGPLKTSRELQAVIATIRQKVTSLDTDRYMADDLATAAELVASGVLAAAVSQDLLPTLADDGA